jgi:hypothetical protein
MILLMVMFLIGGTGNSGTKTLADSDSLRVKTSDVTTSETILTA